MKRPTTFKRELGYAVWFMLLVAALLWAVTARAQEAEEFEPLAQTDAQCGLLVYDWNGLVTEDERGFPRHKPPTANGDWTQPINYADGTFHLRVHIRSQPVAQDMQLNFCTWQDGTSLENCVHKEPVSGSSGNIVTWSEDVDAGWKKDGKPIEWSRARFRDGVAIKNSKNQPVSDLVGWDWNGEDPAEWYPINWRFTVHVVPEGSTFAGWDDCLGAPTAVSLAAFDGQDPANRSIATVALLLAVSLGVLTLSAVVTSILRVESSND